MRQGHGWDLAVIEPAGLPAVEIAPLRRLRTLDALTDEEMVNQLRTRLLVASAPTPSVETLLHAFLPHKFVDHTHADAILELTDQPNGEELVAEAFGGTVAVLPWIMPGFPLAKAVAETCEQQPNCRGVVLLKHGIFTFAETARESYERMIELVDQAEQFVDRKIDGKPTMIAVPKGLDSAESEDFAANVLPVIRGALAEAEPNSSSGGSCRLGGAQMIWWRSASTRIVGAPCNGHR